MNKCLNCSKNTPNKKFCGNKCHGLYIRDKNNPRYKERIKIECKICKTIFDVIPFYKDRELCSQQCVGIYQTGKNNPYYKKRPKKYCKYCDKLLKGRPYIIRKKKFCNNKCAGEYLIGRKGRNYIDGRSNSPYPLEFNNKHKTKIKKRDNYTCQLCYDKLPKKRILGKSKNWATVHHIDYNKNNNVESNLICLCNFCNTSVNTQRPEWTRFFQEKMRVII